MFEKSTSTLYQQLSYGIWGEFRVDQSRVGYLQTKARVGATAKDNEKRLAGLLRPVREVLPTSTMDFNQLLQRDLDDHRVASTLVQYILAPSAKKPVFFPPIVAALLPFEGPKVVGSFPPRADIEAYKDQTLGYLGGYSFGSAFKFEKLVAENGVDHDIKLGRVSWNPEEAKLVVIDGQHRAMALLAIDRTLNGTWGESGEKYKYFYEAAINEALKGMPASQQKSIIESLEFPVTVIWFPDSNESEPLHHEVARKLFVDINKNARTPSDSRILLLSDSDLVSIFTRSLLNNFRNDSGGQPIYGIEYDHPGRDQASSSKWSAISNVMILRDCVSRAVFGPKKFYDSLSTSFAGRESLSYRGEFMRDTLRVTDEIPEIIDDLKIYDITEESFPRSHLDFLQSRFNETWGSAIFKMLSNVLPYKAHGEALTELRDSWATGGSVDTLAKDAVFEGVGMYWTIRDAFNHWFLENRNRAETHLPQRPENDIVKTWGVLEKKATEFKERRARTYLGKSGNAEIEASEGAYDVFATNACQLGLILALRTISYQAKISIEDLPLFVDKAIAGLNQAFTSGGIKAYSRRTAFSKDAKDALNVIPKLDTPFARHFRYFWLELMATSESLAIHDNPQVVKAIVGLRDEGRSLYLDYRVDLLYKAALQAKPELSSDVARRKKTQADCAEQAAKLMKQSLVKWFGVSLQDWDNWQSAQKPIPASSQSTDSDPGSEGSINSTDPDLAV